MIQNRMKMNTLFQKDFDFDVPSEDEVTNGIPVIKDYYNDTKVVEEQPQKTTIEKIEKQAKNNLILVQGRENLEEQFSSKSNSLSSSSSISSYSK